MIYPKTFYFKSEAERDDFEMPEVEPEVEVVPDKKKKSGKKKSGKKKSGKKKSGKKK